MISFAVADVVKGALCQARRFALFHATRDSFCSQLAKFSEY